MAVCALCHLHITDLEGHLKSQHKIKYQQVFELLNKLKDERKFKQVKRLIAGSVIKKPSVQSKLVKKDAPEDIVIKPR